jgi:type VI secretion system protein ImpL
MTAAPLTRLSYYFPWSLLVALLLAILFAVIGIFIYRRASKKGGEDKQEKEPNPYLEQSKMFLSRFGFVSLDPLNKSFDYALEMMRSFIGGTRYAYQLPWLVMLGGVDSGKSTLLRGLDLDRPIGRPRFEGEGGDKPLCDWWFYDHGIVLDLDGRVVINASQAASDESSWKLFLSLLVHNRPRRPLDGVILTIPASELIGHSALSHDDLSFRAEYIYEKLWQMQRITGMRVPIYIVISKCDLIPGFESFCKAIPTHNKSDMFGWSNDNAIDSIYTTEWVDEAFSSIREALYRGQQEIYADGRTIESRDGIFLFPLAFNQIKGGIRTYTDHLFKPSSYHESFFLRGIYCVGDSHVDMSSLEPRSTLELPWHFLEREEEEKRNIYFANNLFENKIFREVGLARPVSKVLLGNTTVIRFAKIAIAVLAVVGTLGLLRANENLQNAKLNLMSVLPQVDVTLEKIRGQDQNTEVGRAFFDTQAQELLNSMTQISVNNLFSSFIPASWFYGLDNKIREVMALVYDRVILLSMSNQLNYKAQQLTSLNGIIPVAEQPGNGIDPLETMEFFRLRNYVQGLKALELAANKFNQLGITSNLRDVADIIKYLFNYEMPPSFYKEDYYYLYAIRNTNVKLFDFGAYQNDASIKLTKLFDEFQVSVFDPNRMIPGLSQLTTDLYEFSGARNYTAYDTEILREIYVSLQQTINSLKNPGLQWLNMDHFDPGPPYEYVVKLILGSNFFSEPIAADLMQKIDKNFINFRKRLANYSSPLFEDGLLFSTENGLALAAPSSGAISLENNLKVFFSEPFMAPTTNKSIITVVPIGSVLLWDTLRLQEAVNLSTLYIDFMNSRFLKMPKSLQPLLQKVAQESLTKNLVEFIANAEVFSSEMGTGSVFSPEDALLSQVQNYRAAAPYLEQLLFALKANNANGAFSMLKSLLTAQTYAPLEKLDEILTEEAPYAIKMNSFDWWTGKNMAALEAFGVSTLTELKNYLELQRDRIHYLAREFAEPLVSFLGQVNREGMPADLPLVAKWKGIIQGFVGYERKNPGNGLVELENFIMGPLNEVTLATCAKYANYTSMISAANDFFVSILIDIQEKLHKQCVALAGYVSADNYTQISQFFNANLAGKFPFTQDADCDSPDADPEDIKTFFEMMDSQANGIKNTLREARNLGPAGKNALAFIEQMDQVRAFFGGYLAPDSTIPNPAFSFDVTFRVSRDKEVRANEVLDWQFIVPDSVISRRSSSHKGYWQVNDPAKVVFRWAANSPLRPSAEEGIPAFEVAGEYVSFSYSGTWALLRLIRQHIVSPPVCKSSQDNHPMILRFDIPLTNFMANDDCGRTATVFIGLAISPVQFNKNAKTAPCTNDRKVQMGQPLQLPYFPYKAPQLTLSGG